MGTITVWTRQHENILQTLEQHGRHTAKREYVLGNEDARLMLFCYDWLVQHHPCPHLRPADGDYPVWLSLQRDAAMLPSPGSVILELEVDEELVTYINIAKWGAINNFSYIPSDEADARRHRKLLADYGTGDAKACMTQFYPELKREIIASWDRLWDESIRLGNDFAYGLIWEVRKEWIRNIIQ